MFIAAHMLRIFPRNIRMVRSVLANMHQGCNTFRPYNGVQRTAIALIALIVFMQRISHISNLIALFHSRRWDWFIDHGGSGEYLYHRDLSINLQNWNRDYGEVEYFYDRYYGLVSSQQAVDRNAGQMHFRDAILQALDITSFHLVTFRDSTVAISYDSFNDVVHLFDSHQQDQYGVSSIIMKLLI